MRTTLFLAVFAGLFSVSLAADAPPAASPTPAPAGETLRVITRDLEPFSFERDGRRVGFAAELWQRVADELGVTFTTELTDSAKNIIGAVAERRADVGVGALTITAEREKVVDFSQPFYDSGLQIAVRQTPPTTLQTIRSTLGQVFNWKSIGSFALLVVAMLLISHLVWMYEHKINEDMWPRDYAKGMWESFWWTISTLLVGGADNKGPVGVGGRIVAIVWMLLSIVLLALLTGSFAANLTVEKLASDINGPRDLPNKEVATIGGSAAETWLQRANARVVPFATIDECLQALADRKVRAVVFDAPILQYALKNGGDRFQDLGLVDAIFDPSNYGFALQQGSPLRERINQALLTLRENGTVERLEKDYFGDQEATAPSP